MATCAIFGVATACDRTIHSSVCRALFGISWKGRDELMIGTVVRHLSLLAFLLCAPLATVSAKVDPPPLEAYGELPSVEDIALSPTGGRLAKLQSIDERRMILVMDKALQPIFTVDVGDSKVRSFDFVTDNILLIQRSDTDNLGSRYAGRKIELFQALIVDIENRTTELVFDDRDGVLNSVFGFYGTRIVDGRPTAFFGATELTRGGQYQGGYILGRNGTMLYSVDLTTNRASRVDIAARSGTYRDWLIGERGEIAARMDLAEADGDWSIRGLDGRIASGQSPTARVSLQSIGRDGSTVIFSSQEEGSEETKLYEVPIDGSAAPVEIFADQSIDRIYTDSRSGRIIGHRSNRGDGAITFYDPDLNDRMASVLRAFDGYNRQITDWSPGFDNVLVRISGNGDSGSHFKVDLAKKKAEAIAYERDAIKPEQVGPISTFAFTAADGLEMDGILTLPPGREPKDLPLVMLPHGGPHAHDIAQFDWWAQAFASRGYAVFQPNFRGSTNRDDSFMRAGYGEWGGKMQTDLSDGLTALARAGIVDPARACIVGGSYGGYAALAGVTLQQGIYRCAVSVNGVADLQLFSRVARRYSGQSRVFVRMLGEMLGPTGDLRKRSPRFSAERADAPVMLIHGRDDTVVPFEQSAKMADALKDAGKPYELVQLDGEDHWLSLGPTRMAMLEAAVGFVQRHNPAD